MKSYQKNSEDNVELMRKYEAQATKLAKAKQKRLTAKTVKTTSKSKDAKNVEILEKKDNIVAETPEIVTEVHPILGPWVKVAPLTIQHQILDEKEVETKEKTPNERQLLLTVNDIQPFESTSASFNKKSRQKNVRKPIN
ncbi:hypothetical protein RF11_00743 [Thelohanellus kitauei]|uniref:Uncharacterized protein n=1 Tax=Thelohanellus kitauei TaxID=669202 RepID=A0A0C2JYP9_THEKT|nr:hypothetical protein RF11_00743 [Thelohanellus kitauei]